MSEPTGQEPKQLDIFGVPGNDESIAAMANCATLGQAVLAAKSHLVLVSSQSPAVGSCSLLSEEAIVGAALRRAAKLGW